MTSRATENLLEQPSRETTNLDLKSKQKMENFSMKIFEILLRVPLMTSTTTSASDAGASSRLYPKTWHSRRRRIYLVSIANVNIAAFSMHRSNHRDGALCAVWHTDEQHRASHWRKTFSNIRKISCISVARARLISFDKIFVVIVVYRQTAAHTATREWVSSEC